MGVLLLQSWAMLAENCPDCLVPLMRSPDKSIEKCVVCEKNYKQPKVEEGAADDGGKKVEGKGAAVAVADQIDSSSKNKGKDKQNQDMEESDDDEYNDLIKDYENTKAAGIAS